MSRVCHKERPWGITDITKNIEFPENHLPRGQDLCKDNFLWPDSKVSDKITSWVLAGLKVGLVITCQRQHQKLLYYVLWLCTINSSANLLECSTYSRVQCNQQLQPIVSHIKGRAIQKTERSTFSWGFHWPLGSKSYLKGWEPPKVSICLVVSPEATSETAQ